FVAGLRCDEMTAPLVIEGAMNGEIFLSYVEQCLAPALNHGDIVVMDNLRAHKVAGVEQAIEAVGAELLYLPKYSPDLNPIEMSFSKLKAYLRKAAERTQRSLRRRIGLFVPRLGADECANYFAHAEEQPLLPESQRRSHRELDRHYRCAVETSRPALARRRGCLAKSAEISLLGQAGSSRRRRSRSTGFRPRATPLPREHRATVLTTLALEGALHR